MADIRPSDSLATLGGGLAYAYATVLALLFLAIAAFVPIDHWWALARRPELISAIQLTFVCSLISTALALAIAFPIAWRLARRRLPGQSVIDVLVDLPMSLSPLVLGMGFLLFFSTAPGKALEHGLGTIGIPLRSSMCGVILGQTVIATAFAIRTLRSALDSVDRKLEDAAREQGLGTARMLRRVTLPACRRGLVVAATITWARTIGEFGPLLLFVGIVPGHSEVLSTAIYLSWNAADLEAAALAAFLMVGISFAVVLTVRKLAAGRPRA